MDIKKIYHHNINVKCDVHQVGLLHYVEKILLVRNVANGGECCKPTSARLYFTFYCRPCLHSNQPTERPLHKAREHSLHANKISAVRPKGIILALR